MALYYHLKKELQSFQEVTFSLTQDTEHSLRYEIHAFFYKQHLFSTRPQPCLTFS